MQYVSMFQLIVSSTALSIILISSVTVQTQSQLKQTSNHNKSNSKLYLFRAYDWYAKECSRSIHSLAYKSTSERTLSQLRVDLGSIVTKKLIENSYMYSYLLAVREERELVFLTLTENEAGNSYTEQVIHPFRDPIVQIEAEWLFGRVYVVTRMTQPPELFLVYEVDIKLKIVSYITQITQAGEANQPLLLAPDPLRGF
jgi:hypothetical protein